MKTIVFENEEILVWDIIAPAGIRGEGADSNVGGGEGKGRTESHFAFITDAIIVMV